MTYFVATLETPTESTRLLMTDFECKDSANRYFKATALSLDCKLVSVQCLSEFDDGDTWELISP